MSDEPDQIIDYAELIKGNVRDLKSFSLDIQTERRAAFDAVLTRTENLLTVAQSKMWKELGFQLHDCKDPPARFFWTRLDALAFARIADTLGQLQALGYVLTRVGDQQVGAGAAGTARAGWATNGPAVSSSFSSSMSDAALFSSPNAASAAFGKSRR